MPPHEFILSTYASISGTTGQMLEAARSGDWDRLVALEQDCRSLIEQLKQVDTRAVGPDPAYVRRKTEIIRKVLADDVEIRKHTEPWMEKLHALLGSARQMHRLERAYGPDMG